MKIAQIGETAVEVIRYAPYMQPLVKRMEWVEQLDRKRARSFRRFKKTVWSGNVGRQWQYWKTIPQTG